ncbi:MAG: hypothetical protein JRI53_01315 [Deltaproteobacteria bacterium]|nr:hypothetical protein [Deltaproteobacteria bacterium]
MPRKRDFACAQQAASKGETIVNYELLRTLSNTAYGSLRFAHRVKIYEKKRWILLLSYG